MLVNTKQKEVNMPEEQEYMTLDEAAKEVGLKRPSLYFYIKKLRIERRYFPLNKHAYIKHADVERIKAVRESPWKLSEADTDPKLPAVA